ncbi:MAG TPA: hypothetical protein VFQ61_13880 [Polyangiaceae bacterium]|nr:hypothetical protein [Polyangiaceae bacterium]
MSKPTVEKRYHHSAILRDERASASVEYLVLVGAVGLSASVGMVAVGVAILRSFDFVRALLLSPIP